MIIIKNLNKTYISKKKKEVKALIDVSLALPDKGLVFVLGKSGSGKTTLLNILGCLDTFDSGDVLLDGENKGQSGNLIVKPKLGISIFLAVSAALFLLNFILLATPLIHK